MKISLVFCLILVFGIGVKNADSYKILMVFPSFSPSHLIVGSGLLKGLAKLGHEVTMVSSFPQQKPLKNYRDVVIPLNVNDKEEIVARMMKNAGNQLQNLVQFPKVLKICYDIANQTMSNGEFRKIMEEESFDLVILGIFANQFYSGLGYHFKCPVAVMSQIQATYMSADLVGNPMGIASTSHFAMGYTGQMTFAQRAKSFIAYTCEFLMTQLLRYMDRKYYDSNFPPDKYPSFDEALRNVSLVLVNHHFSQGMLRAYVPAMVEIGGIHIDDQTDPLPEDIQKFLDSATNGAIFFSFGSNVKTSSLPKEKIDAIIKCFGKLKEKVLLKWETDTLPNKPDNMMIGKWMPQRDILAHKDIKLFVSHGGMGSIAEAKYRGVPLIGVPFFGDQMGNVAAISQEGWAYQLNFDDLTEETFSAALAEVLTNSKYLDTARRMAELYKDRPQTALETANFWIEYVIRHKGAPHMQSNAVHLNFWQNNSIDVIAFFIVVILVLTKISFIILKYFCRVIKRKLTNQKQKQM
uniref:Putative udp-glucoronosyl and udp-glucosyl transferase n=1 Tax=Nyssomyia neivai TaxID=330878 RepID=A0A1L8E1G5_9DIPT